MNTLKTIGRYVVGTVMMVKVVIMLIESDEA